MAASLVTFCAMHGAEPVKATDAKIGGAPSAEAAQAPFPPCPPQDQGLPYTRSAHDRALAHLQDHVAVFAGSRIAWVYGKRVTLDDREPRRWAAVRQGGTILVPARFAGLLTVEHPSARSQPLPYLADRWVWDLERPALPAGVPIVDHEGQPYVNLAALAKSLGLQVVSDPRGLEVVGRKAAVLPERTTPQFDALITLFDSPEQFADPAIPPAWIPALIRQGTWDTHVKVTPQQRALLEGPETRWTMTPATADDLTGFNAALLGSAVPAPSVYPRLLFSPQDVPAVAARIRATRSGQAGLIEIEELFKKSWWDPTTDDGKIFVKLSHGVTEGLEFQAPKPSRSWEPQPPLWNPQHLFVGQKPGIHNTHIWYVPQCLTTMALWCLLEGDDVRGQQVATAIATYYRLRESFIDQQYAISDSEFGSDAGSNGDGRTHWRRSFHPAQHMDLAFALDFGGKWMTEDQKSDLQRIIAKLTYGRRSHCQNGPVRFRDINWMTWDLNHFLATAAIEGHPGFDREVWEAGRESVAAFLEWGISPSGTIFESNGKNAAGLNFLFLSMAVLARHGDNRFGHPHFRRLMESQAQMTSPTGKVVLNSGTKYVPYGRSSMCLQEVETFRAFYPHDAATAWLLSQAEKQIPVDESCRYWTLDGFAPEAWRTKVRADKRQRLPGPTYPAQTRGVVYSAEWAPTTRSDTGLPLDFIDPVQGVLTSRSDQSADATWVGTMVRPNHYMGAGHHHSDAGMLHVSGLGVDWFTQPLFPQEYEGKYFGQVLVDGRSMPAQWAARAAWLGATSGPGGAAAAADLTYAYSWRWLSQPPLTWDTAMRSLDWEVDPTEEVLRFFRGTQATTFRPWWPTSNSSNWFPTCRAPFNPMRRVTRTLGLVRGAHPYALVVDDLDKDGAIHRFEWTAMCNGGVWQAAIPGLLPHQVALAFRADGKPVSGGRPAIVPTIGEPLLLVTAFHGETPVAPVIETVDGPNDAKGRPQPYDRVRVPVQAASVAFRVMLTPVRAGQPLPVITPTSVRWRDQQDALNWNVRTDGRTTATITRDGVTVLATP